MFENSGIINEETIKESKIHAISPKSKKFFKIFSIICSLIGLLSIILGVVISDTFWILYGVFFGVLAVISILVIFYVQNIFQKKNIEMIKEISKSNSFKIETIFNEECAVLNNLTTSAKVEIKYESFVRFAETSNMYLLITKSGQQIFIFKNCLNEEEINSFKKFIKEKCKNIKW